MAIIKRGKIVLGVFLVVLLAGFASAVCCEKTTAGAWCQDVVDEANCDPGFEIETRTSCESTTYCSTGTCVNTNGGTCTTSPQSSCDTSLGGSWYAEDASNLPQCTTGCCLIGDGAFITEKVACTAMAIDYGSDQIFREDITDQAECSALAAPEEKGACISETESGRDCDITKREDCPEPEINFHEGFLCTAEDLGTMCVRTRDTKCVNGENEVYFEDSCGNTANVYDAALVDDVLYWTYLKDPAESCGTGQSNIESATCGNCDYGQGSTCGLKSVGEAVDYGSNICKDLNCEHNGVAYQHGDSWCSEPIANFENAVPGKLSYRLYCYNGEVDYEICGHWRENLCIDTSEAGEEGVLEQDAECAPNRWVECIGVANSKDCLNAEKRECVVKEGFGLKDEEGNDILFTNSDTNEEIAGVCVPKYPPALKFWDEEVETVGAEGENSFNLCHAADNLCRTGYVKRVGTRWKAFEGECFLQCKEENEGKPILEDACLSKCDSSECMQNGPIGGFELVEETNLVDSWAQNRQDFCGTLGDCGVKANYKGGNSYSAWKELFVGNYTLSSLPNADSLQ